jgi:hypothetical protein
MYFAEFFQKNQITTAKIQTFPQIKSSVLGEFMN